MVDGEGKGVAVKDTKSGVARVRWTLPSFKMAGGSESWEGGGTCSKNRQGPVPEFLRFISCYEV